MQACLFDCLGPAAGGKHCPSPDEFETQAGHLANVRFIIDDQCLHQAALEPCRRTSEAGRLSGSVKTHVAPPPGVDSIQMSPPCASTMFLQIASSSPVPPFSRESLASTWWN